jgi:hypothetical protein
VRSTKLVNHASCEAKSSMVRVCFAQQIFFKVYVQIMVTIISYLVSLGAIFTLTLVIYLSLLKIKLI